jgi:hypothetical protein
MKSDFSKSLLELLKCKKRKGKALLPANPNAGIDKPYPFSQINNKPSQAVRVFRPGKV